MKFNWEKSSRTIEVTELPRRVAGLVSADELTLEVGYAGGSSCRKGITLDNAVMPLVAAAPDLLAALAAIVGIAEIDCLDDESNVWRTALIDARAAIAKAEPKDGAIAQQQPIA